MSGGDKLHLLFITTDHLDVRASGHLSSPHTLLTQMTALLLSSANSLLEYF